MPITGYNAPLTPALGTSSWNTYTYPTPSPTTTGTIPPGAPETVPYTPTNVPQTTTASNVADLPNLVTLMKAINDMNIAAQQQANVSRIPGEAGLEQQSSANIGAQLQGQVPADVQNLLRQQGAEQNVGTGRDSQAAYLRALGLTSIGQQQAGQQGLTAATARNPAAQLFDPTSQLLTAAQAGQLGLAQQAQNLRNNELALEWYRALNPTRSGVGGGGGYGPYSGTGGSAMGPLTPTSSGMGNLLFPSGGGTGSAADLNYIDQPYQDWLDALYSGSGGGMDTPTVDQLFPGLGVEQNLPPDWQAGMQLPEYSNADLADLEQLYGAG